MPYTDQKPVGAGYKAAGTSAEAARHIKPSVKIIRARITDYMRRFARPVSADDVAEGIGMSILSVRPRFSEMRTDGLIEQSGERGINASGRTCALWVLAKREDRAQ